ncbi:GNAT family N-acetyltransferase [Bifidobacterium amazonense]|uniref:GNAT family N-acetyltransferase n=1 Tax=Bifidobacterium amazonense TaxID=2809027 RepID=A0ABS9VWJ7_9BIFI|nr:GNAT family N-acetyltransferase [Bifidobacterium amazonense]MCH9276492.1 GNAT family N-acetyltransferase [Bifidobacterium amazonense]
MSEHVEPSPDQETSRELPARIVIPPIKGEMVHLRPATVEDLPKLDELDAYYNASRITGKDAQAERAVVHTWVRRSVAWAHGQAASESGVGDPESRRTIAWAVLTDSDHDDDGRIDAAETDNVIGMVFLIDVDGWARSARIQVVLGKDYRGRGYSRDMMPRVMTYGFAPEPAGLGLHRIWVAVPEKNTRSLSVYQSLGFVKTGSSRDALWDAENSRYQDLIVLDTLFDEYDPIRSLDAFGMHVIEDNPGMREALAIREHSIAIQQRRRDDDKTDKPAADDAARREAYEKIGVTPGSSRTVTDDAGKTRTDAASDETSNWPYGQSERKSSKNAWWRNLGLNRKRDTEED